MSGRRMDEPCPGCGRTGKRLGGHGRCMGCYKRARRQDPEYAEQDRQWSREWKNANREANRQRDRERLSDTTYRGTCTDCDGPMGVGVAADGLCRGCASSRRTERLEEIARMWREGVPARLIAEALGTTAGVVYVEVSGMRSEGLNLPHRRRVSPSALSCKTPGNQNAPATAPTVRERGNQEDGS